MERRAKCQIGVMGSSNDSLNNNDQQRIRDVAERLGAAIALRGCTLVTGATTGMPDLVSRAARRQGGLTVGISPAISETEQVERYKYPIDAADVMVYTGFGLKGRNVINIRSSDIVIILGGGMGTLNEFTIAFDEGKIVGVLEDTGGIADSLRDIVNIANKPTVSTLIFSSDPERLVDECLTAFRGRGNIE